MSGQFAQRRLARPSYQLDVLDSFVGEEQLARRRELRSGWRVLVQARRRLDQLTQGAAAAEARVAELRALVEETEGMSPELEEELRAEREQLRHGTELVDAAARAAEAIDPDEGAGAAGLAAQAEAAIAAVERLAPELAQAGDDVRDAELRLREAASVVRSFLAALDTDPARLEQVEAELERIADAKRRFRCDTVAELLERAYEARAELAAIDEGADPVGVVEAALAAAEEHVLRLAEGLGAARREAAPAFADAVAACLHGIGLGDGEFRVELSEREVGPSGADEVTFLIRPNRGLPFAPVAETASGGELSRIALAIAAVGGGETMVFDEIDAGIGGHTAHAVAETLTGLTERSQVIAITHLPQIASRADRHFRVEKVAGEPTVTRIAELGDADRRDELERMLGGREFLALLQE
jgi:DNA repair protein RecN (Recombination protein N)